MIPPALSFRPNSFAFARSVSIAYRNRSHPYHNRFSTSSFALSPYDDTIPNLQLTPDTRVIYQGFTGKQATVNAQQSLEYGTRIVGGVTPGRDGEHLGLPVLPSVRAAKEHLRPDASAVFVAADQAARAIEEAIEAEVPLVVAVAEHIPLHDMLRVCAMLETQSKTRLVGANSPGLISARHRVRVGFQPLPVYAPGHVGVVARSGTLSYETVAAITRAGLGQSTCVGVGGDIVAGTSLVDALRLFERDDDTHAVALVGEIGGRGEEEAADWIAEYRERTPNPKPIAALVAGMCAHPDRVMGHAGAWVGPGENSAQEKYDILAWAGATMVNHPSQFGETMKRLLDTSGGRRSRNQPSKSTGVTQQRGLHTSRSLHLRPCSGRIAEPRHRRAYHLSPSGASSLLAEYRVPLSSKPAPAHAHRLILTIDRTARCPCFLIASPPSSAELISHQPSRFTRIPFPLNVGGATWDDTIYAVVRAVGPPPADITLEAARDAVRRLAHNLYAIFTDVESTVLDVHLAYSVEPTTHAVQLTAYAPNIHLDDAAFRSAGRHAALHAAPPHPTTAPADPELRAREHGIVHIPFPPRGPLTASSALARRAHPNIGTLVNGAGLALNTCDALRALGGRPANFLDTGGRATADTVAACLALLRADPRVRVVFVNVFGGLTRGEVIAEGIVRALEMEWKRGVPVVVRLRGTNEAEGQQRLRRSGLRVKVFDDFEEAAREVVRLAEVERGTLFRRIAR